MQFRTLVRAITAEPADSCCCMKIADAFSNESVAWLDAKYVWLLKVHSSNLSLSSHISSVSTVVETRLVVGYLGKGAVTPNIKEV